MKIGFLSDLHVTHNTNMKEQAIQAVEEAYNKNSIDKLFLAGDTTNNYKMTLEFVDELVERGLDVYVIFGNHEYWSVNYEKALEIDHDRYINNMAMDLGDVTVIAIDGYFDYSFVREVNKPHMEHIPKDSETLKIRGKQYFDLKQSKIKNHEEVFKDVLSNLRKLLEDNKGKEIILMTHYVPHEDFVRYMDDFIWNTNNAFMGSKRFGELAEEYGVDKVIFGHTHTQYNKEINGVSYHCNPVGYGSFEYEGTFRDRVDKMLKIFEY